MTTKKQKKEIMWNLINSALAGALVLFGGFTTGNITVESLCVAFAAAMVVALTKFKDYWTNTADKKSYAFTFVG